jgi:acyl-homoserine lactone acylase PvdQ
VRRRFLSTRALARAAAVGALALVAVPTGASAGVGPEAYGTGDSGSFRNVLPSGENGTDNALGLAAFMAAGTRPAHWMDQLPLYTGLVYASPTLTKDQIPRYYKDATFGVRPDDIGGFETPRPGLTIVRDAGYGVPHIYGTTRADVMFGTGWAGAEDRLFLMDILRHTGRANLSSFIGGSASNRDMDRTQWALAPYTEADLQSQVDNADRVYGVAGRQIVADVTDYVAGINAYIDKAMLDPTLLPGEYAALGKLPQHWTITDVLATASLIGGIFGKGGGAELPSALTLEQFEKRFGVKQGRRSWRDFREKNDPETPTTVLRKRFRYESTGPFAKRGLALPDPGSVKPAPVAPPVPAPAPASAGGLASIGAQLKKTLRGPAHASNWLLVAPRESASGRPIAVMGPQVGYYVPEILMEEDLHGPDIDARGATFPGVNLYVQLGHGRDYAWSATTATSDNVDTFAEVLCQDDFHYVYKGECLQMDKLERANSWQPNLVDSTAAGSETLTAYRTVHGIVFARGTVHGKKVAFVSARTTYFHEADSALGFSDLNDPAKVHDARSFQEAASKINFAFNWSYVGPDGIAYYLSGWYPERAKHTSPDFPILGTGKYDWQGYDPELHTMKLVPFSKHPNAINPRYLISWNNKQAPGWSAADDQWAYGPVFRSHLLERRVRRFIKGPRKIGLERLVQAMEEPATQDIRAVELMPVLLRALGRPTDPRLRDAIQLLRSWRAAGGHRRDLNRDGHYDEDAAVTLMDAWWPKLVAAEFQGTLGNDLFDRVQTMIDIGSVKGAGGFAPDFEGGWWGYVSKDLRDLYGPRPKGRWSRVYCGGGSRKRCRQALQFSLKEALSVTKAQLYGREPSCAATPEAACHDMNRFTIASGISQPPFPFQNRPTFQQVVEIMGAEPR